MPETPRVVDVQQFHGGRTGVGCLAARFYAGLLAVAASLQRSGEAGWETAILLLLASALVTGLRTRTSAAVLTVMLASAPAGLPLLRFLAELMGTAAVVLLGAGAFSLDAHLVGRRRISIPGRSAP